MPSAKQSSRRREEFRRRLRLAKDRALYTVARTHDEIAKREPHQAGSVWEETATQAMTDTLAELEGRLRHAADEIAAAQGRLESGAYGVCETCGQPIALARLRALPVARDCARCAARSARRPPPPPAPTRRRGFQPIPVTARAAEPVAPAPPGRSPKAPAPQNPVTAGSRARRRARSATAVLTKGTTLFQTDQGPRAAWPASAVKRRKR